MHCFFLPAPYVCSQYGSQSSQTSNREVSITSVPKPCNFSKVSGFSFQLSDQIRSVTQSCPTLCHPMNRSTPGLPVHHQLPEFTESHVHRVSDAIQPSHILCRPLLLLFPIPPSIRVFSNELTLCMMWPKYWSFSFSIVPSKEHPGLISFRMDWLDLLAVQIGTY